LSKELNDRVVTCARAWGVAIERTVAIDEREGVDVFLALVDALEAGVEVLLRGNFARREPFRGIDR